MTTQEQIVKEIINMILNLNEPERTMYLLNNYEFVKKVKMPSCCF